MPGYLSHAKALEYDCLLLNFPELLNVLHKCTLLQQHFFN
jgi:hypothetical protein